MIPQRHRQVKPLCSLAWTVVSVVFVSSPEHQVERRAVKTECFAEAIDQITLIRKMNAVGLICKNYKGGRADGNLGCKVEFDAPAMGKGGVVAVRGF